MKSFAILAILPVLAIAAPAENHLNARQAITTSISTKTVTATKTVFTCPTTSSTLKSTSSSTSSTSKPASSPSSVKPSSSSAAISSATSKPASSSSTTTSTSKAATSTSSSSAAAAPSGVSNADRDLYLKLHNDFRKQYGANNVTWDTALSDYALKTAQTCKYGHTGGPYGENIAAGVGGGYNINSAFTAWGPNEAPKYDYNNPGFSSETGHFTQIVWKSTTKIGCASASCPDGSIFSGYKANSLYVVCEYAPYGNIVGNNGQYFKDNVGRKVA